MQVIYFSMVNLQVRYVQQGNSYLHFSDCLEIAIELIPKSASAPLEPMNPHENELFPVIDHVAIANYEG